MKRCDSNGPSVIVIGAGLSGLAVARALKCRGASVRVFDKARRTAESWRRRHPQLRLNTHRWLSSLPGLPMPRSAGAFPSRDTVIRYLEDYADRVDVPIHLGVTVQRVEPGQQGWRVDTNTGNFFADHVVIATGRDQAPLIPAWPGKGEFTGQIRHAADLGSLDQYRGRRILVVGAGNSGTDVLNHLATIDTASVWVSVRHGPVVFPKRLAGLPVQLLSPVLERLPAVIVDRMLTVTERIAFGRLSRWGMKRHRTGGATRLIEEGTAPAIDDGFIDSLKAGRAKVVPEVEAFTAHRVKLADGNSIDPEVVLCATGYLTGLDGMLGHLGVLDARGAPLINGTEQDPRYPGLWFTGMRPGLSGFFLAARRNAAGIARAVSEASLYRNESSNAASVRQSGPHSPVCRDVRTGV